MRRMIVVCLTAALAAALMLLPAGASARSKHKHRSCPSSARVDRNRDRIPDRWECRHKLSLKVKQTNRDPDHDGLNNLGEFQAGDDPHRADSDGDGVNDGNEHAGTIQSFVADQGSPNTGTLTIALAGNGTVTGKVTSDTRCQVRTETPTAQTSDNGEQGDDRGDDHPGDHSQQTTTSRDENEGEEPDGDNHDGDHADEGERACTAADFTQGRAVTEADLKLANGQAIFKEIELG